MTGFGWLAADPSIPRTHIAGIELEPGLPTRWEEYTWVRNQVARIAGSTTLDILDAGTGITPKRHILPEILATDGHYIIAVDSDPETLKLLSGPFILRITDDMTDFKRLRHVSVDIYVTVSVVEHIPFESRALAWDEAFRILRPGGTLLVTADGLVPQELANEVAAAGFLVGGQDPFSGQHLTPTVAYLIAKKPSE